MWWSYLGNAFLGTIMLITMLFCIGDLNDAIESDAPYLVLFTNTGSTPVALLLSIVLFILIFVGNINALATTSRELWAFSRDKGFPFSKWISHVSSLAIILYYQSPRTLIVMRLILDESQMECSFQLRLPCFHHRQHFLLDQSRLNLRLQYYRLTKPARSPLHLHDFHRLCASQAPSERGTASCSVESRKTWTTRQCVRFLLQFLCHHLLVLPW